MRVRVGGWVWLDASELSLDQVANLKHKLTVRPRKTTDHPSAPDPEPIRLYIDRTHAGEFGVPRGFYVAARRSVNEEIEHVSDGAAMSSDIQSNWRGEGPFAEQGAVVQSFEELFRRERWGGWILEAGCGFGKTATALEISYRRGRSTLIIVHKSFLAAQWEERIRAFYPGARVGRIQQDRCEYDGYDFTIGMLDSLAIHASSLEGVGDTRYPVEIADAFGTIIYDEVHRVGASTWSTVVPMFNARYRIGLTATPRRKDGAEPVFYHHIGQIAYKAVSQAIVPKVRVLETDSRLVPKSRRTRDGIQVIPTSNLTSNDIVSQLVSDIVRNDEIANEVAEAVLVGRKVMVISERLEHLKDLEAAIRAASERRGQSPTISQYVGSWFSGENKNGKPKMRTLTEVDHKEAERAQVILATRQMVEEGLDISAVDTGVLSTPMSDVEQAVGRIRRHCLPEPKKCPHMCPWRAGSCEGKPEPIVVDVVDSAIPQAQRRWDRRRAFYRSIGSMD